MSLYILYGSQTGNAEDIARDLASRCEEQLGLSDVLCDTLNSQKKTITEIKAHAKMLVVICSTTGNGDAPENAESFWRSTKLRSAAKDLYLGVKYAVLGLGDTNYDKFCHMGKAFHKRIGELGGEVALELHCADEATGLEDVVDDWVQKILDTIKEVMSADGEAEATTTTPATAVGVDAVSTVATNLALSDEAAPGGSEETPTPAAMIPEAVAAPTKST